MKRRILILETAKTARTPEVVANRSGALTVGDLREYLEKYDEDDFVVISHDRGLTFGTLYDPEDY